MAQTQTAGYSLRARPRRNCVGEDLLAEFAMTKPEITKNISTPTQPNHVKGAADGGDGALEPWVANRNPGRRPEHLVKKCDAEGGPEAQRIQQGKMVLNGSAPNA